MIKDNSLANALYWSCYLLGFIAIFIFNTFYAKHYSISKKKALAFTVSSYAAIYLWAYVLAFVINGFEWGHHNAIRVYIWFPLVLLLFGKLFKIDFRTSCEYMAPSTCIVYGIARFGCVFAGCCYGIPASWGMYSFAAGERCFPIQLFEALSSLLIGVILVVLAKKKNYRTSGTLYPIMLVLYGGARFIWEFFSAKPHIFIGLTELGVWALGTAVMGIVWLTILKIRSKEKKR